MVHRRKKVSTKGMHRTSRDRVVCRLCLKPISKTGHIRKHFDDSHGRAAPVLLKATEAHLYEEANDGYEASTVAGPYQD